MSQNTPITNDIEELKTTRYIVGMDEVGRGCVAGPISASAVCCDVGSILLLGDKVRDSKLLTELKRIKLHKDILSLLPTRTVHVNAGYIDDNGINAANLLAFLLLTTGCQHPQASVMETGVWPKTDIRFLIDGESYKELPQAKFFQKGEGKYATIAAASIIAKVARDQLMHELSKQNPDYGFDSHKGYGTAQHTQAIRRHGRLKAIHRQQFVDSLLS